MIERIRPRSIRVRLTLWYTATLALGLLAYGGGTYGLLRHGLSAELDRQLHADFERAEHDLQERKLDRHALPIEMTRVVHVDVIVLIA